MCKITTIFIFILSHLITFSRSDTTLTVKKTVGTPNILFLGAVGSSGVTMKDNIGSVLLKTGFSEAFGVTGQFKYFSLGVTTLYSHRTDPLQSKDYVPTLSFQSYFVTGGAGISGNIASIYAVAGAGYASTWMRFYNHNPNVVAATAEKQSSGFAIPLGVQGALFGRIFGVGLQYLYIIGKESAANVVLGGLIIHLNTNSN